MLLLKVNDFAKTIKKFEILGRDVRECVKFLLQNGADREDLKNVMSYHTIMMTLRMGFPLNREELREVSELTFYSDVEEERKWDAYYRELRTRSWGSLVPSLRTKCLVVIHYGQTRIPIPEWFPRMLLKWMDEYVEVEDFIPKNEDSEDEDSEDDVQDAEDD
jgi:hypothetical protein